MTKPKQLHVGDKVAIVSLSSGILGEDSLAHQRKKGTQRLNELGLEAVFMPNSLKGFDYLSEHPEARARDLKQAFQDDEIKGIVCSIGGFDTLRLIPYLLEDPEFVNLVRTKPKLFTGFSDTTNNHLLFYKLGVTSFYGPNFINDLAELDTEMLPYTKQYFGQYLKNDFKIELTSSPVWYDERTDFSENQLEVPRHSYQEQIGHEFINGSGTIQGKLLGGCLESLHEYIKPEFLPETLEINEKYQIFPSLEEWTGKIIFLETSEEFDNLDKMKQMIADLDAFGLFEVANALIIGKPQDGNYYEELKEILIETTAKYELPMVYNLNFGHAYPRCIIPYGLTMSIDFEEEKIQIDEPLFSE